MSIPSHFRFAVPASRLVLALTLFASAALLAIYSFAAAVPPNGTLTPAKRSITYTDGPLVSNPTHLVFGSPECAAPNSCSDFTLTVSASSLAATHNLLWTMQWPVPNVDCDMFILKDGYLVSANIGYSDPSHLALPIPADGTVYHLVTSCSVGTNPLTGTAALIPKYPTAGQGAGAPARYINYSSGPGQATDAGEPSIGVDWNPNVASLKNNTPPAKLNTGGVALFTAIDLEYRANFDDCSSPALNVWEDTKSPIITGLDPIGFVDHFRAGELGRSYPPPQTPGRAYHIELAAGSSTAAYSDNDGGSWISFLAGGPPAGLDHETLGGGPFHDPVPTPPAPAYPNALYYCSQFGAENASCSMSPDGGVTFGPGVPIFPPQLCAGGIHGHVKVSPQGTAYVPNSACAEGTGPNVGVVGVALSKNNGVTWTQESVPGSTGSADPAVGIGQNNVGKPAGQVPNTLYIAWPSADGHMHAAHSPDEGTTWQDDIDISSIFGIEKTVFAAVTAGDDNRAAVAFLGTDPAFYPGKQVWHLYIATTYDGGKSWILVDATPTDPVQIGGICLLGTGCSGGRNLLDFIGIDVDAEGRVLVGYADGCLNCSNAQPIAQSNASKGAIARQSGGPRLFSAFDPIEPAPPAAPRLVSALRKTEPAPGVEVGWLEPDNGGSPITGYNIYRSSTSGTETLLATVSGAQTTKYFDQNAPATSNWFYRVTALNDFNGDNSPDEGSFCRELSVDGVQPVETACAAPYLTASGAGAAGTLPSDPTMGELTIQRVAVGEPFIRCNDNSITFVMKVATLDPSNTGQPVLPPNAEWKFNFDVVGSDDQTHAVFVSMDTFASNNASTASPNFSYGRKDPRTGGGTVESMQCFEQSAGGVEVFHCDNLADGTVPSASFTKDGTITIRLNFSVPLTFDAPGAPAIGTAFTWDGHLPGTTVQNLQGSTILLVGALLETVQTSGGTYDYARQGNAACVASSPIAVLTGAPLAGSAPLTVNFSAAASSTTNPCGTISSYTMEFGDGSAPVTQASPLFSHIYTATGLYQAKLTVKDSTNLVSTNPAQLIVNVGILESAVSRKTHGSGGPFDINLPLAGSPGVECRRGAAGDTHQVVFNFPRAVTVTGATATPGAGGTATAAAPVVSGDGKHVTVNLSNVSNVQTLRVTLNGVSDNAGATNASYGIEMRMLLGDTNGDNTVNSGDAQQTRGRSGQLTDTNNFRSDVNTDGTVNSGDAFIVRGKAGTGFAP